MTMPSSARAPRQTLIIGPRRSGKTYEAIQRARASGKSPVRVLAADGPVGEYADIAVVYAKDKPAPSPDAIYVVDNVTGMTGVECLHAMALALEADVIFVASHPTTAWHAALLDLLTKQGELVEMWNSSPNPELAVARNHPSETEQRARAEKPETKVIRLKKELASEKSLSACLDQDNRELRQRAEKAEEQNQALSGQVRLLETALSAARRERYARVNDMLRSGRLFIGCDFGAMASVAAFNAYLYACGASAELKPARKTEPAPSRPEPKFKVGQKVIWGDRIYEVNRREWCSIGRGVWTYGAADSPGLMHEPDLKPAPKFAVGEWVTRDFDRICGKHEADFEVKALLADESGKWKYLHPDSRVVAEHELTAQTPQHKHDCAWCVFLGRDGDVDLYFDAKNHFDRGAFTYVAKFYTGHAPVSDVPSPAPYVNEARRRAVARGLVK